jgi:hypothetical protein
VPIGGVPTIPPKGHLDRLLLQSNGQTEPMTATSTRFNGWANYETWNVSLWIQNDYETYRKCLGETSYDSCIPRLELLWGQMTPDGVRWMDGLINTQELDEMLTEMKG